MKKRKQTTKTSVIDLPSSRLNDDRLLEECSELVLEKFTKNELYTAEDIADVATEILSSMGTLNTSMVQMKIAKNQSELKESLETSAKKHLLVLYNSNGRNHWVILAVLLVPHSVRDGGNHTKTVAMYKDPLGNDMRTNDVKVVRDALKCQIHCFEGVDQTDSVSGGALCLRNFRKLCQIISQTDAKLDNIVEEFKDDTFKWACQTDLKHEKRRLLLRLVSKISSNNYFLRELRKLFNNIRDDVPTYEKVKVYHTALIDELEKTNNGQNFDETKIDELRSEALNVEKLQDMKQKYCVHQDQETMTLELEQTYHEEMKSFKKVCWLMQSLELDDNSYDLVKSVYKTLEIDFDLVRYFYDIRAIKRKLPTPEIDTLLSPKSFESVIEDTSCINISTNDPLDERKSLDDVVGELFLEHGPNNSTSEVKSNIKNQLDKVDNLFQDVWQTANHKDIAEWTSRIKGKQAFDRLSNPDEVCEAVAVTNRANELVTGKRLRIPQIATVLIFMNNCEKDHGKILQVSTGEGKTTIISLLATLKALQGETVDVITSNPILAKDGVEKRENFYALFGLSVGTNNPHESTVAEEKDKESPSLCNRDNSSEKFVEMRDPRGDHEKHSTASSNYTASILYGTISNFQFDFLRDHFEGSNIRKGRRFGCVIMDEIDSMLIDSGAHVAKLAEPFPGMEYLKHVYIRIWQELIKAEALLKNDITAELNVINGDITETLDKLLQSAQTAIVNSTLQKEILNVEILPPHLRPYAKFKLKKWVHSAVYARYCCEEDRQYRIVTMKQYGLNAKVIVPVDNENTGVSLMNTMWSDGLHQFLQIKHNLCITSESLTSSYISNLGYVIKYGTKIYGLTGTVGSDAEKELLSGVYKVRYGTIPTYKEKKFKELEIIVANDDDWEYSVCLEVERVIEDRRAVLVICQTVADVKTIADDLRILGIDVEKIRSIRYEEDSDSVTCETVHPGMVIVATNLAGRGTDLITSEDLEVNGGLHVLVSFLPYSKRVEDQAFGRTSRQGQTGTGRLVVRRCEMESLGCDNQCDIKETRDARERCRLDEIRWNKLQEIILRDVMFEKFSEYYQTFSTSSDDQAFYFVVQDFKECWASWLEQREFEADDRVGHESKISDIYDQLQQKASVLFSEFLKDPKTSKIVGGRISYNPYNSIMQAEFYVLNNENEKAKIALEWIVCKAAQNDESFLSYYPAHVKRFELAIEGGHQLLERFRKAVAQLFFISVDKDERYKETAIENLIVAERGIKREIDYFRRTYDVAQGKANDFQLILVQGDSMESNAMVKHLYSRMYLLDTYCCAIKQLKVMLGRRTRGARLTADDTDEQEIEDLKNVENCGVAMRNRVPDYTLSLFSADPKKLKAAEMQLKSATTLIEVHELSEIGLDVMYAMRDVHDVSENVIHSAQIQIGAGIAALVAGLAFPPSLPILGNLAGTFISEGVCDIVIDLLSKGDSEFSWASYLKGKAISYGVAVCTMGITAIASSTKILQKAINGCKSLAAALRSSQYLHTLCSKLATLLEKLAVWLEKCLANAIKAANATKAMTTNAIRLAAVKSIAITVGGSVAFAVFDKIISNNMEDWLQSLKPTIEEKVDKHFRENLVERTISVSLPDVHKKASEILAGSLGAQILEGVKSFGFQLAQNFSNVKFTLILKSSKWAVDTAMTIEKVTNCCSTFCSEMNAYLRAMPSCDQKKVDFNDVLLDLVSMVTEHIFQLICGCACNTVSTAASMGYVALKHCISQRNSGRGTTELAAGTPSDNGPNTDAGDNPTADYFRSHSIDINTVSESELRAFRKKMAFQLHPDKNLGRQEWANAEFKHMSGHYENAMRLRGFSNAGPVAQPHQPPSGPTAGSYQSSGSSAVFVPYQTTSGQTTAPNAQQPHSGTTIVTRQAKSELPSALHPHQASNGRIQPNETKASGF